MNVSREEAAQALGDIEAAGRRSMALRFYAGAAPYLVLWGLIWLGVDLTLQVNPGSAVWLWPVAGQAGGWMCGILGLWEWRRRRRQVTGPLPWKGLAGVLVLVAFIAAMMFLIGPDAKAIHVFWGVFFGALYMLAGIRIGARGVLIGAGLFGISLGAYLFGGDYFYLVMGLAGGAGMILGGLWLWKA